MVDNTKANSCADTYFTGNTRDLIKNLIAKGDESKDTLRIMHLHRTADASKAKIADMLDRIVAQKKINVIKNKLIDVVRAQFGGAQYNLSGAKSFDAFHNGVQQDFDTGIIGTAWGTYKRQAHLFDDPELNKALVTGDRTSELGKVVGSWEKHAIDYLDELEIEFPNHPELKNLRRRAEAPHEILPSRLRTKEEFRTTMRQWVKNTDEELDRIYDYQYEKNTQYIDYEHDLVLKFNDATAADAFSKKYGDPSALRQMVGIEREIKETVARLRWSGGLRAQDYGRQIIKGLEEMMENNPELAKELKIRAEDLSEARKVIERLSKTIDRETQHYNLFDDDLYLDRVDRAAKGSLGAKVGLFGMHTTNWLANTALPVTRNLQMFRALKASQIPMMFSDGNLIALDLAMLGIKSKTGFFGGEQVHFFKTISQFDQERAINRMGWTFDSFAQSAGAGVSRNRFGETQRITQGVTDKVGRNWGRLSLMNQAATAGQRTMIFEYASAIGDSVAKGSWDKLAEHEKLVFARIGFTEADYNKFAKAGVIDNPSGDGLYTAKLVDITKLDKETKQMYLGTVAMRSEHALAVPGLNVRSAKQHFLGIDVKTGTLAAEAKNMILFLQTFPFSMTWQRFHGLLSSDHSAGGMDIARLTAQAVLTGTMGVWARDQLFSNPKDRMGLAEWVSDDYRTNLTRGMALGLPFASYYSDTLLQMIDGSDPFEAGATVLGNPRITGVEGLLNEAVTGAVDMAAALNRGEKVEFDFSAAANWKRLSPLASFPQTIPTIIGGRFLAEVTDSEEVLEDIKNKESLEGLIYNQVLGSGYKVKKK